MADKAPMTSAGYQQLTEDLRKLKGPERTRIVKAIADARGHGDLSENAEYHAAKDEQGHNETRIKELEDMLGRAEIIDISKLKGKQVKFGARVSFTDEETNTKNTYQIVGEYEADIQKGKISFTSPIAHAFIGKKAGDFVEVTTPGGEKTYKITAVKFT